MKSSLFARIAGCGIAAAAISASAMGNQVFTATAGTRSAQATFDVVGSNLQVTLSNISMDDVLVPIDVLTGVFFDISGSALSLSRVSAVLANGSTVAFGTTDPGNVVGGEWAYASGLSGAPHAAAYGIASAGFGLFGPGHMFPGNNLQGPASPNGLEYGITSMGDNLATGNTPVTGSQALIKHSVVFTLGGVGANFDLSRIGNVSFQYGTALDEPNISVPTPGAAGVLALGAAGALRRRRR
jgi:MYXO-CTERM domain-containing protein